jgi:rhodanese-related sulfurtransferase
LAWHFLLSLNYEEQKACLTASAQEYEREHLPEARPLPLQEINQDTTAELRRDVPVIVYCYDAQ